MVGDGLRAGGSGNALVVNLTCMLPLAETEVRTSERRRRVAAAAAAAARFGQGAGRLNEAGVW